MKPASKDEIKNAVRKTYGRIAASDNAACGCNSSSCCDPSSMFSPEDISKKIGYTSEEVSEIPLGSNMGLGCGNPQVLASLKNGEHVLDLGSGGGFDCFLAARAVGKEGYVIGVDMTPEMVTKARQNKEKSGQKNIEFRLGEIEHLPVADKSIDVIISNCVINLSPEKEKVFQDAYRVLKNGGRLAISDIVTTVELPETIKNDLNLHCGCIAGASSIIDLREILESVGFKEIKISPKGESKEFIKNWAPGRKIEEYIVSANIEAVK